MLNFFILNGKLILRKNPVKWKNWINSYKGESFAKKKKSQLYIQYKMT
jgi:hypothetical protein